MLTISHKQFPQILDPTLKLWNLAITSGFLDCQEGASFPNLHLYWEEYEK